MIKSDRIPNVESDGAFSVYKSPAHALEMRVPFLTALNCTRRQRWRQNTQRPFFPLSFISSLFWTQRGGKLIALGRRAGILICCLFTLRRRRGARSRFECGVCTIFLYYRQSKHRVCEVESCGAVCCARCCSRIKKRHRHTEFAPALAMPLQLSQWQCAVLIMRFAFIFILSEGFKD